MGQEYIIKNSIRKEINSRYYIRSTGETMRVGSNPDEAKVDTAEDYNDMFRQMGYDIQE